MATKLKDVMTENLVTLQADAPVAEAARRMRDANVGDVIVVDGEKMLGILTDRDIVVRCLAENLDPSVTSIGDIASINLTTVGPDTEVDEAVKLLREHAIKRLVVADGGRAVGVISMGDLAEELDPESALADVSRAIPNR